MSICDRCIHADVCGEEGAFDEALTYCDDFLGWIPVSERLPEKEGTYLLWGKLAEDEDNYCFIGDYDEGCEQFGYWEEQFDSHTLGWVGSEFYEYECVIAWQPLPEPYKAESEE